MPRQGIDEILELVLKMFAKMMYDQVNAMNRFYNIQFRPATSSTGECRDVVRAVLSEILLLLNSGKVDEAKKRIRELLEEVYSSEGT